MVDSLGVITLSIKACSCAFGRGDLLERETSVRAIPQKMNSEDSAAVVMLSCSAGALPVVSSGVVSCSDEEAGVRLSSRAAGPVAAVFGFVSGGDGEVVVRLS